MADKYWEDTNEFLRVFAKAYGKLVRNVWTNKQYNQHMADFYRSKEMFDDADYHQNIADNGYESPHNIKDRNTLP